MTEKSNPSSSRPIEAFKTAGAIAYGGSPEGYIPGETTEIAIQDGSITESNLNQFAETSSGSSLDVTIDGGEAFVFGSWVCIDTQTTVSLNASTTGQTVYVGWNKNGSDDVIIGLDSAFSSASGDADQKIPVWEFDTDGSGVTSSTDLRSFNQFSADNIEQGDGSGLDADSVDGFDKTDLDSLYVDEAGDSMSGPLQLGGDLSAVGGETIWDESTSYIPQGRLQNDSLTVAGNTVALGGTTNVNHEDISNISTDDHHTKTSSASELTDVSPDSVSGAHHSRYDDSEAISAINNDDDHGSTAQHNYFSGSHNDLSDIGSSDHHTRYSDEEAQDSVGNILNSDFVYDDAGNEILLSNNSVTVAGNTVSLGSSTPIDHSDLSNIDSADHHTRYSDEEAQDAIAGPFLTAGNGLNKEYLDNANELTLEISANSIRENELDETIAPTWSGEHTFSAGITGLPEPIQDSDAARKVYVDSVAEGLDIKESVRVCAETNIDLTSTTDPNPVDGVTLANGDRVLLKNQTDGTENGIYVANTATDPSTWARSDDADEDSEVTSGLFVFVEGGDTHTNQGFVLTTNDPITLGTTSLSFTQFSGAESFTAGAGITQSNNTISHTDTSSQSNVSSSAGSAIVDLEFDTFGHVTGATTDSFDSRYVNKSGDTLSGSLSVSGIDLDGSAITDSSQDYLDLTGDGNDLRLATDQSIQDGSGTERLSVDSGGTQIYDSNGQLAFNIIGGGRYEVRPSGDSWRIRDDNGGFTAYEYQPSSSAPGKLELTNADLSIPGALEADKDTGDLSIAGTLTENASL